MVIRITEGDLLKEQTDAIINTVNCVGVMGKGIALQFKQKWPTNFKLYEKACKAGEVRPGKMFVHDLGGLGGKPNFIINFPTKDHWKGKSKLSFIEEGLQDLVAVIRQHDIRSIAMPPLGCGNGGLEWTDVKTMIEKAFAELPEVEVHLYEPKGAPEAISMVVQTDKPSMTAGRAVLIKLIDIYKDTGYLLSKIEIQKLGYFAHIADVLPKLNYGKNRYGPYSDVLNHALLKMNGHFITGFGDNDKSEAQISVVEEAIKEAEIFLDSQPNAIDALERIAQLIDGFETPYGMELLATVHWAATNDVSSAVSENVIQAVYNWEPSKPEWGARKKSLMQEAHIRVALERLQQTGWLQ